MESRTRRGRRRKKKGVGVGICIEGSWVAFAAVWNGMMKSGVPWRKSRLLSRSSFVVWKILRKGLQEGRNLYCRVGEFEYLGKLL